MSQMYMAPEFTFSNGALSSLLEVGLHSLEPDLGMVWLFCQKLNSGPQLWGCRMKL